VSPVLCPPFQTHLQALRRDVDSLLIPAAREDEARIGGNIDLPQD
jgi:hypothetical protein